MKKNILFVVDEKRMGGVSVLLSDIINLLNKNKYNIDICVLHNAGDYLDNINNKVNIIYGTKFFDTVDENLKGLIKKKQIRKIFSKLRLVFLMKTGLIKHHIIKERKKMQLKNYDVEIAFKDGFCALFTIYGTSKRKIHWLHTDYQEYDCVANYKKLFTELFHEFDKIIAISNPVKERFLHKYPNNNVEVIYNIVNQAEVRQKSTLKNITYDNSKLNLISVGRIHNMKGYDRLIDVMHILDQEKLLDNVVLRIIGTGPDDQLLESKVKKYNLEDKVLLLGLKRNPYPYVSSSSLFIMCSRYEPFGLVVIESLILGVPVFSLEEASIREILDPKYGYIEENSEKGLYEGLKKVINNPSILKKYKMNLKNYHYQTEEIIAKIEEVLDEK